MSAAPQPYPEYRESGVEWLGRVPSHWEVRRLKTVCRFIYGDSLAAGVRESGAVPVYGSNGQVGWHSVANAGVPCVVIGRKGSFGKVQYSSVAPFVIDTAFFVDGSSTSEYLPWLQRVLTCLRLDDSSTDSAIPGLDRDEAHERYLPVPPSTEQRGIVRFLDDACHRMGRYIAAKRRRIELLEEEKQAVVSQAVTRGLDPSVPMKPSGVEWLGDIPAHWERRRLRSLATIGTGERDTVDRKDSGKYPFYIRSQVVQRIDTWAFDGEAVLTAGDGGVGKVFHYASGKFDYHQRVYKFSDFRGVSGRFFFLQFRALLPLEVSRGTAKSTVESLRLPMLQNFPVAVPPPAEQRAIARYLDRATAALDAAASRTRRQIELMEEYRTRLIADVVTGQLDVREAARPG